MTMRTMEKLQRYEQRLRRYHLAVMRNDPLVSKPTYEECELTTYWDKVIAKRIDEKIAKEFPCQ